MCDAFICLYLHLVISSLWEFFFVCLLSHWDVERPLLLISMRHRGICRVYICHLRVLMESYGKNVHLSGVIVCHRQNRNDTKNTGVICYAYMHTIKRLFNVTALNFWVWSRRWNNHESSVHEYTRSSRTTFHTYVCIDVFKWTIDTVDSERMAICCICCTHTHNTYKPVFMHVLQAFHNVNRVICVGRVWWLLLFVMVHWQLGIGYYCTSYILYI